MNPIYQNMLNLPRPASSHPKMSRASRAAQFLPFSALSGYEDKIKEAGRLLCPKPILSQGEKQRIGLALEELSHRKGKEARLTYFAKDQNREEGTIQNEVVVVARVKKEERFLLLEDKRKIPFDDLLDLVIVN